MVSLVFPNHMTTAMTSLQLVWILQVNNVAAYRINFILDLTQWVAYLLNSELGRCSTFYSTIHDLLIKQNLKINLVSRVSNS